MKTILLSFTFFLVAGCATAPPMKEAAVSLSPIDRLRSELAVKFDDPNFFNANWGVVIQSLKTGEIIYERNENKSFMPASNMKLFTTSAALTSLTPDFHYYTMLATNGTISNGILHGDVFLKGSGDPTICGRFNGGDVLQTFDGWADSVKALGVNAIDGNLVGDDDSFDEEFYGDGWDANYETDWYAAQFGGIVFNDNCVDMTITPSDSIGKPASVTWNPPTNYITVVNETVITPPDSNYYISFYRERGTNKVHVRGNFPVNKPVWHESIAADNPTLYAMTVLKEEFERRGIKVDGVPEDIDDVAAVPNYDSTLHLASYTSPALSQIVKAINKPSQNLYAEQLFRTMGMVYYGKGGMRTGRYVANPIFTSWGMDTTRMRMIDGCGLSRLDLVSPANIVALLTGMYRGKYFQPFYESLPIAGVDGSLRNRMKGTAAENNVHAKTGFIGYVRSLSGYVTSLDGEIFAFSMMANHYTVPTSMAEKIQNDVCVLLASFSRSGETKLQVSK
ncbi:MAG: D-alanyl-D-alanine carboxypeptidase/D-alanyl-D-alanine-endopeptidase [Bacteroidota bacterium]|nr:D-alanyl-D-alanine carboxypeptidase/D-alanyl-D-alanine-endopeptidase [Bacteroidota bacterium]